MISPWHDTLCCGIEQGVRDYPNGFPDSRSTAESDRASFDARRTFDLALMKLKTADVPRFEYTRGTLASKPHGLTPLDPTTFCLSVLIPVYNELNTIDTILDRVRATNVNKEIICVDDCSTDGTRERLIELRDAGLIDRLIFHSQNGGKGKAIRSAIQASTGDIVIVQDADLEYDPQDWGALLMPIVEGKADACFGSRFLSGPHRVLYYWHSVVNQLLTTFSNMLTNLNLTDMETCYKAIRGDLARSLILTSDRFGFEPEVTARLAQRHARIYEVPISYAGRTYAEGKQSIGAMALPRFCMCCDTISPRNAHPLLSLPQLRSSVIRTR